MARIYLGRQGSELGGERLVVVKQILPILASSAEFSRLLIEEAKLAAKLSHGNVVQVIDLGREADTLYIAMEYVEGFDLSELLKRCSKGKIALPLEFGLLAVIEALRALDYSHRKKDDRGEPLGIVHRDVSPSNVLISFDGEIKLCDFGIARAIGTGADLPSAAVQGKAGYMSPEAANAGTVDARSDVFSAGIILWELIAGRRLYRADGRPPSLDMARRAEIPSLPNRGLTNENDLHRIVTRALAKDPAERYQTARDFLRELEDYIARSGLLASPLRFGEWLMQHFGADILEVRRAREGSAKQVEAGAVIEQPVPPPSAPLRVAVEPPPASLVAVVHSQRKPEKSASESRGPGVALWVMIGVVILAIVVGILLR